MKGKKKFSLSEIIIANDLCAKTPQQCALCPFNDLIGCVGELAKETIDFMNRQQAELNDLKIEIGKLYLANKEKEDKS